MAARRDSRRGAGQQQQQRSPPRGGRVGRVRVGSVIYQRLVHAGETYAVVDGFALSDADHAWKVKVDRRSGRRFYVSLGQWGRRWLLPAEYPPPPPERSLSPGPRARGAPDTAPDGPTQPTALARSAPAPAAAAAAAAAAHSPPPQHQQQYRLAEASPAPALSFPYPRGGGEVTGPNDALVNLRASPTHYGHGDAAAGAPSPLELLSTRACFDPTQLADPARGAADGWTAEREEEYARAAWQELRLAGAGQHLSAAAALGCVVALLRARAALPWGPLEAADRAELRAAAGELAAASAQALAAAPSPLAECSMQLDYSDSVAAALRATTEAQSEELSSIRAHIALREEERRRAAEGLAAWKRRCAEADKDAADAAREGAAAAAQVARFLDAVEPAAAAAAAADPCAAQELTAEVELLRARVQEQRTAVRAGADSYARVAAGCRSTQWVLERMQQAGAAAADAAAVAEGELLGQLEAARSEAALCRSRLAEAQAEVERLAEENSLLRLEAARRPPPATAAAPAPCPQLPPAAAPVEPPALPSPPPPTAGAPAGAEGSGGAAGEGAAPAAAADPGGGGMGDTEREALLALIAQQRALLSTLAAAAPAEADAYYGDEDPPPPPAAPPPPLPYRARHHADVPPQRPPPRRQPQQQRQHRGYFGGGGATAELVSARRTISRQQEQLGDLRNLVRMYLRLNDGDDGDAAIRAFVDTDDAGGG